MPMEEGVFSFAAGDGAAIRCSVKRSKRARAVRLSVYPGGRVEVVLPRRVSFAAAEKMVAENRAWVERKVAALKDAIAPPAPRPRPPEETEALKARAAELVRGEIEKWNRAYRFPVGKVVIKDQRSKWGSCSSAGTIAFNYRIVFLPPRLASYLVIHELCHLAEQNHGPQFWKLVEAAEPDWKILRRELRAWPF